jgi:hypothetical protein
MFACVKIACNVYVYILLLKQVDEEREEKEPGEHKSEEEGRFPTPFPAVSFGPKNQGLQI